MQLQPAEEFIRRPEPLPRVFIADIKEIVQEVKTERNQFASFKTKGMYSLLSYVFFMYVHIVSMVTCALYILTRHTAEQIHIFNIYSLIMSHNH
jgi:hypothetical protein